MILAAAAVLVALTMAPVVAGLYGPTYLLVAVPAGAAFLLVAGELARRRRRADRLAALQALGTVPRGDPRRDGRRKAGAPMSHDRDVPRHARRAIVLRAAFLAAVAVGLAGCASQSPGMFQTHSAGAHDIAVLTYTMFAILSVVLITVWSLLAYVVIRFRHRTEAEASRTRGNTTIEVLWTAIPAVIVAVLFALTMLTTGKLIGGPENVSLTVTGHQWWWQVSYAGADFETANEIHLPAGTAITADLLSADVIHQFSCPQVTGKVQMIPGTVNHISFLPITAGTYLGVCAQFCGVQHAHMHFLLIVQPPAQFKAWFANQMKPAVTPDGDPGDRRRRGHGRPAVLELPHHPRDQPERHVWSRPDPPGEPHVDRRRDPVEHPREPPPLDRRPERRQAGRAHADGARHPADARRDRRLPG